MSQWGKMTSVVQDGLKATAMAGGAKHAMSLGGGHVGHMGETEFFFKQQNCGGLSASFSGQPLFFLDIFSGPPAGVTLRDTEGLKRVTRGSGAWVADASAMKIAKSKVQVESKALAWPGRKPK